MQVTSSSERPFRIYLCGSYRDREGDGRNAKRLLLDLERDLVTMGFDAFTQLSPRAIDLAGRHPPAEMTRRLDAASDLTVFVGITSAREGGWAAEVVDLKHARPEGAKRRAVLLERGFPLSQVLDSRHGGHLADPYVVTLDWEDADELLDLVVKLAAAVSLRGQVPAAPSPWQVKPQREGE